MNKLFSVFVKEKSRRGTSVSYILSANILYSEQRRLSRLKIKEV